MNQISQKTGHINEDGQLKRKMANFKRNIDLKIQYFIQSTEKRMKQSQNLKHSIKFNRLDGIQIILSWENRNINKCKLYISIGKQQQNSRGDHMMREKNRLKLETGQSWMKDLIKTHKSLFGVNIIRKV
ncbi:unnamed protein product [Paramecium sonneborni]|uniref:Uncharacterized protein n=1 Tax=Paramecium sonneborni TaxID=65129 RepID=A0A8S1R0J0_9CILI|nr:unnamed protein product [Paramecium sonneborni]